MWDPTKARVPGGGILLHAIKAQMEMRGIWTDDPSPLFASKTDWNDAFLPYFCGFLGWLGHVSRVLSTMYAISRQQSTHRGLISATFKRQDMRCCSIHRVCTLTRNVNIPQLEWQRQFAWQDVFRRGEIGPIAPRSLLRIGRSQKKPSLFLWKMFPWKGCWYEELGLFQL